MSFDNTKTVITAGETDKISFRAVWRVREMYFNLVRTAALKPYTGKSFGYLWTLLRPFIFLAVMVFIKHRSSGNMGDDIEYPLFLYSGLILWWYFVDALKQSSRSPNTYRGLITKIYFPRIIIPAVPVASRLFDLFIQITGIVGMMVYFGHYPGSDFYLAFFAVLNMVVLAMGFGYILSVTAIISPDVERILDYILYVGLFVSPVIYGLKLIPEQYQTLYIWLNPVAGPLLAFRAGLFSGFAFDINNLLISMLVSSVVLILGAFFYQRVQASLIERM